jgi:uncharacterized protein (DUF305 family)
VPAVRQLLPALAVAALFVAGCGDDDESAGNPTDRAFVAEMVPHHEAAVQMAQLAATRGQSEFVRQLAADIVRTQRAEIAQLRREDAGLAEEGVERGELGLDAAAMGMDHDTASLRTAKPFDAAFLQMMLPHHEGALTMSRVELDKGGDPELKALARRIIDGQTSEIARMREHLRDGRGAPAGAEHGGAAHE